MAHAKPTIVLSGMIAADPCHGGATWAVLQYLLGLQELGCDVYLIEPIKPGALHPAGTALDQSTSAAYFRQVIAEFRLLGRAALLLDGTQQTFGLAYGELLSVAARADLLINISGMLTDEAILQQIPIRAYLDLDPAFNQWWHAQGIDMHFGGHTHFITIGQALGQPDCPVPTCGRTWIHTFQPVVLSHWPVAEEVCHAAFTTVGNWRSYGSVEADGVFYGQKAHSLRQIMALPTRTTASFLLAMGIDPGERNDLAALAANRWKLIDPARVTATPAAYRDFIRGSYAEIGVAKSGYALSRCGWFSDRSACYLASGRPVVAQDTGFRPFLPSGQGLLAFTAVDDAAAAVESIRSDYARHARAARLLAEEYFDSTKVLSRLLDRLGVAPSSGGLAIRTTTSTAAAGIVAGAEAMVVTAALQAVLAATPDFASPISAISRQTSPYRSSFALEEITARWADGRSLAVIFKDLGWQSLTPAAERAKPSLLYDPLREIDVYRRVLAGQSLGTARCYGAVVDPAKQRYWLFLEKAPGAELYQYGELAIWARAAHWLSRFHQDEELRRAAESDDVGPRLVRDDIPFFRRWIDRAVEFVIRRQGSQGAAGLVAMATRYDEVAHFLASLPATFIHGEFYASNVLVDPHAGLPECAQWIGKWPASARQ